MRRIPTFLQPDRHGLIGFLHRSVFQDGLREYQVQTSRRDVRNRSPGSVVPYHAAVLQTVADFRAYLPDFIIESRPVHQVVGKLIGFDLRFHPWKLGIVWNWGLCTV